MPSSSRATLIGAFALLMWSFLALLTQVSGKIPPFQMVAMAFALASLIALIRCFATGRAVLPLLRQPVGAWVLAVFGLFGYHACYFLAMRTAPALEANLINYLWPLLIVLFSAAFGYGGRLKGRHVAGGVAGLAGAVVVITKGRGIDFDPAYTLGYGAALACGVIWAFYSVANRRYAAVPTEAVGGFCALTALLALIASLLFEAWVWPQGWQWAALLALGLGPVGAAFFAWDHGCKHGNIRALGALAYGVPLLSNALLILFGLGELSWPVGVGAVLIIGGATLGAGDSVDWGRAFSAVRGLWRSAA